jgi:hypothetical protein
LAPFASVFTAVHGNVDEFPPYDNNFGGDGGNIIQNNFDFYEKNDPENGFIRGIYGGPNFYGLRNLKISGIGVEVLSDYPNISGDIITNTGLFRYETDVYYRVLNRDKEIDLDKSTLNGSGLSEYNIKYETPDVEIIDATNYNEIEQIIMKKYSNNEIYIT